MSGRLWNRFLRSSHPFDIYWTCGTLSRFLIRAGNKRQQQLREGAIVKLVVQLIDRTQLKRVKKENIFIISSLKFFRWKNSSLNWQRSLADCPKSFPDQNVLLILRKHTRTSSVPWNSKLEHDISQVTHTGRRRWMLRTFQRLVHQHRCAILREFSQQKASFCTENLICGNGEKNPLASVYSRSLLCADAETETLVAKRAES